MNRFVIAFFVVFVSGILNAQRPQAPSAHNPPAPLPPPKAARLVVGYGDLHHPVTTTNPEAQKFFDQRQVFLPARTGSLEVTAVCFTRG